MYWKRTTKPSRPKTIHWENTLSICNHDWSITNKNIPTRHQTSTFRTLKPEPNNISTTCVMMVLPLRRWHRWASSNRQLHAHWQQLVLPANINNRTIVVTNNIKGYGKIMRNLTIQTILLEPNSEEPMAFLQCQIECLAWHRSNIGVIIYGSKGEFCFRKVVGPWRIWCMYWTTVFLFLFSRKWNLGVYWFFIPIDTCQLSHCKTYSDQFALLLV